MSTHPTLFAGIYFSKFKSKHAELVPAGTLLFTDEWHAFQWCLEHPYTGRRRMAPFLVAVEMHPRARQVGVGGNGKLRGQRWSHAGYIVGRRLITAEDITVHNTEQTMLTNMVDIWTGVDMAMGASVTVSTTAQPAFTCRVARVTDDSQTASITVLAKDIGSYRVNAVVDINGVDWKVIDDGGGLVVQKAPVASSMTVLEDIRRARKREKWHASGVRDERRGARERQREEGALCQSNLRTVRPLGSFIRAR
jgi:hypothetical protein